MQKPNLTKRQREVLEYIRHCIAKGRPLTRREIADHLGGVNANAVQQHVVALETKGYIRRWGKGFSRAITLTDGGRGMPLLTLDDLRGVTNR